MNQTVLLVTDLDIFTAVKHEKLTLTANAMYELTDIKHKDLVTIKFRYEGKSYYTFRGDLLRAMHNPKVKIESNVGLPGQRILNFKTNTAHKVLRVVDDKLLLPNNLTIERDSLEYGVIRDSIVELDDHNFETRDGVKAYTKVELMEDKDIPRLINLLTPFEKLAFDTETVGLTQVLYTLDDKEDFVTALTVSTDANSGYYVRNTKSEAFKQLIKFLGTKHLIMHNATFDLTVLKVVYDVEPKSFDDTLVMAKLMNENLMSYSLKTLTDQILKRGKQLKLGDFDYLGYVNNNQLDKIEYILAYYAVADTANTYALYNYTSPKLESDVKLSTYYRDIELASILPVAVEINRNGLTVDKLALEKIKVDAEEYVQQLLTKMADITKPYITAINNVYKMEQDVVRREYADEAVIHFKAVGSITTPAEETITRALIMNVQFNVLPAYGSLKKLAAFHKKLMSKPQGYLEYTLDLSNTELMEKLVYTSKSGFNLPLQKSETGRPSFNKKAINELEKHLFEYEQTDDIKEIQSFFKAMSEHSKTRKLLDAFVYPTLENIKHSKDNKLHPSYNLLGTVSSRASCSNPNFQQLANNKSFDLRKCFVVEDKSKYSFLQFDFEAQELYVMGVLSQDPTLLTILRAGRDAHAETVRRVWPHLAGLTDLEIKEQHKDKRDIAKVVLFSLAYGARAKKMAFILGIPIKEAERVLTSFKKDAYPVLAKWLDDAAVEIKKYGEVEIVGGYRRRFKSSGNSFTDQGILRSIVNSLIQGASAYITKICTLKVLHALNAAKINHKLVILIHDSMTIQVADEDVKRAFKVVEDTMKFVMHGVTLRSEGAINKDMSKLTEQKLHEYEALLEDNGE